jgi:hypothetical protein
MLAAAVPVVAQVTSTVPPHGAPAPPKPPATPEARMQKANDDVRQASERLKQIEVPMDVEPAFSFKA